MDAFQIRLDFLSLLKRLNASQQSIQKVLSFADRHVGRAGSDIWDCILAECAKVRTIWAHVGLNELTAADDIPSL